MASAIRGTLALAAVPRSARLPPPDASRARVSFRCFASAVEDPVAAASKPRIPRLVGMGSKLVGCGSAVPNLLISNDDLAEFVETSDEWISVRTGIRNRRVLTGDETLSGLAIEAGKGALEMAQVEADDVDLVIMCTSTPDDLFGGGTRVQKDLGCKNAWAFDVTAACSGFLVGLITATRFIKGGGYKNILVIGADALSRYVDWTDRGTCILFGDAAGAVLVQDLSKDPILHREVLRLIPLDRALQFDPGRIIGFPDNPRPAANAKVVIAGTPTFLFPKNRNDFGMDGMAFATSTARLIEIVNDLVMDDKAFTAPPFAYLLGRANYGVKLVASIKNACSGDNDGLLGFDLQSDGNGLRHLNATAKQENAEAISNTNGAPLFPPRKSSYSCIHMNGKEVFRFAVTCVPQSIEAALEEANLTCSDIDWLLLHQANQRILDSVATRLRIPQEKVISNLANYGNTSAATIPLALDEAVRSGKVRAGDTIATAGFGAGLTWGSAIVKWG